jgi:16S rRNA (adenine1518-N6/adenine1519-N6)-dimethyltransferase
MQSNRLPRANKELGQNFLINQGVIDQIVQRLDPKQQKIQAILEVGPGPGALTFPLRNYELPLYLIEQDKRLVEFWREEQAMAHVFHQDAARFDVGNFLQEQQLEKSHLWFVSNLPYNAGIPILRNFLDHPQFGHYTIMLQREVAQKICLEMLSPKEMKKSMNSLAALCSPFFTIELVCRVSPGSFRPAPKVHSAVIHLTRKETPLLPLDRIDQYEKFLTILFRTPRKTLSNVLKQHLPLEKWQNELNQQSISPQMRAETLNLEQILYLYQLSES